MASAPKPVPPVLKPITQFVTRGRELVRAKKDEAIAYHCFKHAMDIGLKLHDKSPESEAFLMDLMTELEAMKPHLAGRSREEQKEACETFAKSVLAQADAQEQAGVVDKGTAQAYYAASTFFEILKQFDPNGQLDPDTKQLVLYAKYRANEIITALKEGRVPVFDMGAPNAASDEAPGPTTSPSAPPPAPRDDIPMAKPIPASVVPPLSSSAPPVTMRAPTSFGQPITSLSKAKKSDCLEYIKFARAALEAEDVPLTIERLQAALSMLHQ